ncbi:oligopeptide/dipeptide ABC transporter ATP-binding protein [Ruthenibacterium lactatiformans]|uniref:oligopeptide/dipeptide ABC transporter ATP-binding protein n=1 Tax=Ruthenibacterium lactatiformans TaxID=1550024 RepID=UPI001966E1F9|nr:ATP-binding cassette domain-containing protein [Ruthenibacterium lactatiformans]
MSEELVRVEHLKKYFKVSSGLLKAVDDVSFSVARGETLGLVGESGCGKSTVGRSILRLQEPTEGGVYFRGENILLRPRSQMKEMRGKLQIVFQDPYSSLDPRMNVLRLIEDSLRVNGVRDKKERLERVRAVMDVVGLEQRLLYSYPHELDGGRRQRIGIARALVLNPDFIVMDEPVSALDVCVQAQILNLLCDLQDKMGLTYLFISHNLSVVKHLSSRIAVMYLGKIVEIADKKTLFASPKHPYTQALLSSIPLPKYGVQRERIVLEGDVPSPINLPSGCRFQKRCPYAQERCTREEPELVEMDGALVACHYAQERCE